MTNTKNTNNKFPIVLILVYCKSLPLQKLSLLWRNYRVAALAEPFGCSVSRTYYFRLCVLVYLGKLSRPCDPPSNPDSFKSLVGLLLLGPTHRKIV